MYDSIYIQISEMVKILKKHFNKVLSFILAAVMIFSVIPAMNVFAATTVASGKCGADLTWKLDSDDVLTVSGKGSMAHAPMLGARGVIKSSEAAALIDGLEDILEDLNSGKLKFDMQCEDIHMFVEQVLTERLGDVGKKLHTARSRDDRVALDIRMYLRNKCDIIKAKAVEPLEAIKNKADMYKSVIMPGYTRLQRAQPVTFGHHLMAYAMMLLRDIDRLDDCKKRMTSPLSAAALSRGRLMTPTGTMRRSSLTLTAFV